MSRSEDEGSVILGGFGIFGFAIWWLVIFVTGPTTEMVTEEVSKQMVSELDLEEKPDDLVCREIGGWFAWEWSCHATVPDKGRIEYECDFSICNGTYCYED